MKTDVEIYTDALVKVIQNSREYREFEETKLKFRDKPELMNQINQFRMDSYKLQNYPEGDTLYERTEKFYEKTSQFRENPLVEEYLSRELAVCRMLQKIFSTVVDSVDLQLDEIARQIPFGGDNKS